MHLTFPIREIISYYRLLIHRKDSNSFAAPGVTIHSTKSDPQLQQTGCLFLISNKQIFVGSNLITLHFITGQTQFNTLLLTQLPLKWRSDSEFHVG